jgi:ABC-type branched-subunit amino acid transport system substrate-binding protein
VRVVLKAGPDRKAVEDAIRTTEFTGVTGTFKFDANGDTTNQAISAYKVTGGKWEQILKK